MFDSAKEKRPNSQAALIVPFIYYDVHLPNMPGNTKAAQARVDGATAKEEARYLSNKERKMAARLEKEKPETNSQRSAHWALSSSRQYLTCNTGCLSSAVHPLRPPMVYSGLEKGTKSLGWEGRYISSILVRILLVLVLPRTKKRSSHASTLSMHESSEAMRYTQVLSASS